jgi:hypothetical protein
MNVKVTAQLGNAHELCVCVGGGGNHLVNYENPLHFFIIKYRMKKKEKCSNTLTFIYRFFKGLMGKES